MKTTPDLSRYVSAADAAKIMGMHPRYVRRLCAQGKIACVRFGKVFLVVREAAEAYQRDPYGRGRPKASKEQKADGKQKGEPVLERLRDGRHEKGKGRNSGS